jgi:hypothetical protein
MRPHPRRCVLSVAHARRSAKADRYYRTFLPGKVVWVVQARRSAKADRHTRSRKRDRYGTFVPGKVVSVA